MKLTIVRDDNILGVDGVFRVINLSSLDPSIRAVQWDGTTGHTEYYSGPNTDLADINAFQFVIDLWTAAAPVPPVITPADRRAEAHERINTAYELAVNALTAGYPSNEIASWPKQEQEARALMADPTTPTPWLLGAATSRGISVNDFAVLVINNANALAPLHGSLTGKRQKLRDQIDALPDNAAQSEFDAIQW